MDTATLPNSLRFLLSSGKLSKQSIQSRSSLLILRHSDRPAIPPNSITGAHLNLTPNGHIKARQFGACLESRGILPGAVLMSSAMTRTAQTLLSICSGANWRDRMENIEINGPAAGPGLMFELGFSLDSLCGNEKLRGLDPKQGRSDAFNLFNCFLTDKIQFKGVKPFDQAAVCQLNFLKELLDRQKKQTEPIGLSILVAHDTNLLYLLAYCFGTKEFSVDTWPTFLDGVLLQSSADDENTIIVTYGEKSTEVKIP